MVVTTMAVLRVRVLPIITSLGDASTSHAQICRDIYKVCPNMRYLTWVNR